MKNMKLTLGIFFLMGFAFGAIGFAITSFGQSPIEASRLNVTSNVATLTHNVRLDPSVEAQYAKFRTENGLNDTTDALTLFLLNNVQKRLDEVNYKLDVVGPRLGIDYNKIPQIIPTIRI